MQQPKNLRAGKEIASSTLSLYIKSLDSQEDAEIYYFKKIYTRYN
jgi:hypothetical protein